MPLLAVTVIGVVPFVVKAVIVPVLPLKQLTLLDVAEIVIGTTEFICSAFELTDVPQPSVTVNLYQTPG